MYSIAQQAVANGYGKIEYLRAQPIALSRRVRTTASPRSASSPEVARRGAGGGSGLATRRSVYPAGPGLSKVFAFIRGDGYRGALPWTWCTAGSIVSPS